MQPGVGHHSSIAPLKCGCQQARYKIALQMSVCLLFPFLSLCFTIYTVPPPLILSLCCTWPLPMKCLIMCITINDWSVNSYFWIHEITWIKECYAAITCWNFSKAESGVHVCQTRISDLCLEISFSGVNRGGIHGFVCSILPAASSSRYLVDQGQAGRTWNQWTIPISCPGTCNMQQSQNDVEKTNLTYRTLQLYKW